MQIKDKKKKLFAFFMGMFFFSNFTLQAEEFNIAADEILIDKDNMILIEEIKQIAEIQSKLEKTLIESSFVPYTINGSDFLLRIAPGIFPQEFHGAINLLNITREIYKNTKSLQD